MKNYLVLATLLLVTAVFLQTTKASPTNGIYFANQSALTVEYLNVGGNTTYAQTFTGIPGYAQFFVPLSTSFPSIPVTARYRINGRAYYLTQVASNGGGCDFFRASPGVYRMRCS